MTEDKRPRFVADSMLGSLARWLRMLGYDTAYEKDMDDGALIRLASEENRRILTRDKELAKEPNAIFVEPDDLEAQLKLVGEVGGLSFSEEFIRCSTCNGELKSVSKNEIGDRVPEGALANNDRFWICSACSKIYWQGSHWLGIRERFRKLNLA